MNSSILDACYAAGVLLAGAGVTVLRAYLHTVKMPQKLQTVAEIARQAVQAAEETGGKSADKYTVAADAVTSLAKRVGLNLKPEEVTSFIQAAVKEMHDIEAAMAAQPAAA